MPFTIHTADGRRFPVFGRDKIFLAGANVIVVNENDDDDDILSAAQMSGAAADDGAVPMGA